MLICILEIFVFTGGASATELSLSQVKALQPQSVKAVSYSATKIKVTWKKISGADGYVVYRALSKNGTYKRAYRTTNADKLYYINTGRTTGKKYFYRVRGFKIIGGKTYYTKYSPIVSACAKEKIANPVPDYVQAEAERVAAQVKKHQNENTISFLAVSDLHVDSNYPQSMESARHAGQAMSIIKGLIPIDFGFSSGDMTVGSSATTIVEGRNEILEASKVLDTGFSGITNFRTIGNHDPLGYSYPQNREHLTAEELYSLIGEKASGVVYPKEGSERGYCYKDFYSKKIRVICLNTSDVDQDDFAVIQKVDAGKISGTQMKWFVETLDLSAKKDASEWSILILSHHPLDWGEIHPATRVLNAYEKGSRLSMQYDGAFITYNYKGRNSANIIAQIHGHTHTFKIDNLHIINNYKGTPIGIKRITIPNACFGRNNEYGVNGGTEYYGIEFGETVTYEKTAGTEKDTAFCVVTIDMVKHRIYLDCYGAGYDRIVEY